MAKRRILKAIFFVLSSPFLFVSRCLESFLSKPFSIDLNQCLNVVDQFCESVPSQFTDALIAAEDHRNAYHLGVDPIGIIRAILVHLHSGHLQGASTIEQQFVRVVTGRYERTVIRKLREQALAIAVVRYRAKNSIASAYLSIAFFGNDCIGLDGLRGHFGPHLHAVGKKQALFFVSQLKYPRPHQPNVYWRSRVNARCEVVWARHGLGDCSAKLDSDRIRLQTDAVYSSDLFEFAGDSLIEHWPIDVDPPTG